MNRNFPKVKKGENITYIEVNTDSYPNQKNRNQLLGKPNRHFILSHFSK